ncbi:hypothetical protein ACOMHN_033864 [Nucella lapillus]
MPSGCTLRRSQRRAGSARESPVSRDSPGGPTLDKPSSSQRPRQGGGSLASKLRKRMLMHVKEPVPGPSQEKRVTTVRNDDSGDQTCDARAEQPVPCVYTPPVFERLQQSTNLAHYLYAASLGCVSLTNRKSVVSPVVRQVDGVSVFRTASFFERRVTVLDWHPTMPYMIMAGSKGGDLILWNCQQLDFTDRLIHGRGAGCSIQAVKAWPWNMDMVLTASIDGQVVLRDWEHRTTQVLSDTLNSHDHWYCSLDVSAPRKVVVTGDNVGKTTLLSSDGKKVWTHRLHKQKVSHAEFSPREDWLLCTASTDAVVKVWDLRQIKGPGSALCTLRHDKPINSAYFSRTDGCRLLTTDQFNQVRVYRTLDWRLERTVEHPHRFFQHLTPIKATWHPLQDLIVIGRYPHKDTKGGAELASRTIDIIDVDSGNIVCQLFNPELAGIVSLNKFNDRGDYLASGMGLHILVWCPSHEVKEKHRSLHGFKCHLDLRKSARPVGWSYIP